ncbi:MAG: type I methionyl aminopeptidase [Spirochaetota bacterium]|nr:type I methionyl aminopeptidase [Spirochaetota bacterium]
MGIYLYNLEQVKRIEEACLIVAEALDKIEEIIDVGTSTYEIDRLARDIIDRSGGRPAFLGYRGYPAVVCTSINQEVVHGIPDKGIKLEDGDIIGIDIGVEYKGFYGDTARTYAVGKLKHDAELLLKATKESLYAGVRECVVGNRISDISNAVETCVRQYGFSPVRDYVGHGIGNSLHEEPSIPNFGESGRGPRIINGMVLAIEPMINIGTYEVDLQDDGWTVVTRDRKLSAHFEHTIAVIEGRAKILTKGKRFN